MLSSLLETDALGPEPALALHYAPEAVRRATGTLWRLDRRVASVATRRGEPRLRAIKLAWWDEALRTIEDHGGLGDPLLGETARLLLTEGLKGHELALLAAAWREEDLAAYAATRASLFRFTARLAGCELSEPQRDAAAGWALMDRAATGIEGSGESAQLARACFARAGPIRWPRRLRSLGALSLLARRDAYNRAIEARGAPARVARMLGVWLTGFDN